jgi:ATP/maltotriose-dependent transcriptional regulator MalT
MATHKGSPVPPLHRRHLRRPRLTRLLDASAAQSILITAPAGYGKTSLACEWLAGRSDVAWYRATAASADLAAFSVGVSDAIQSLVPDAGKRLRQRLLVSEPPEKAARPMAELLAEDLEAWPDGARLVLDDYHLVANSAPVEEFVDWLLTLAGHLRVVVTSRHRPKWASARRLLQHEILEMGHQQLAMSDAGHTARRPLRRRRSTLRGTSPGMAGADRPRVTRNRSGDPGRAHDGTALPLLRRRGIPNARARRAALHARRIRADES